MEGTSDVKEGTKEEGTKEGRIEGREEPRNTVAVFSFARIKGA